MTARLPDVDPLAPTILAMDTLERRLALRRIGLSLRQIARIEAVSHQAVAYSLQNHGGDPFAGQAPTKRENLARRRLDNEKRRKTHKLSVRVSDVEMEELRLAAKRHRLSAAAYLLALHRWATLRPQPAADPRQE